MDFFFQFRIKFIATDILNFGEKSADSGLIMVRYPYRISGDSSKRTPGLKATALLRGICGGQVSLGRL
jgi:hypothetical protein